MTQLFIAFLLDSTLIWPTALVYQPQNTTQDCGEHCPESIQRSTNHVRRDQFFSSTFYLQRDSFCHPLQPVYETQLTTVLTLKPEFPITANASQEIIEMLRSHALQQEHNRVELLPRSVVGPQRHNEVVQTIPRTLRRDNNQLVFEAVGAGILERDVVTSLEKSSDGG